MITIVANPKVPIALGKIGENERLRVRFDESALLLQEYPGATIMLLNQRPSDVAAYPCTNIELIDDILYWTITNTELKEIGTGHCEIVATLNNVVAKSVIYATKIYLALDNSEEAPEPWHTWQQRFIEMISDAETAAANAAAASQAVVNMDVNSVTLAPGSDVTVNKLVDPDTGDITLLFGIPRGVDGTNGIDGRDGEDGFSPSITITQMGDTHRVTVTDANGSREFDVVDGIDGTNGRDGIDGVDGINGVTFIPTLLEDGTLTWTNDGDLPNPQSINIKGPPGEPGSGVSVHICSYDEYNQTTRVPIIRYPQENTFYLVPSANPVSTNMFDEWIYTRYTWEKFGTATVDVSQCQNKINATGVLKGSGNGIVSTAVAGVDYGTYSKPVNGIPTSDLEDGEKFGLHITTISSSNPLLTMQINSLVICGTVNRVTMIPCSDGTCGVIFTSGSVAAELYVSGTVKWPYWFNPIELSTHTTYWVSITNGTYANVQMWATADNTDGIYTEAAKTAIKNMIGVEATDISSKADKVTGATSGNFAGLDSNGNLTDSGHKHSDYLTSHQDITGKADKVTSATLGNFASLDSNGNLVDSGHKHSDYLTAHQTIPVTDIQINGTSILANNVANVPLASYYDFGVVKLGSSLALNSSNAVNIVPANISQIKTGTTESKLIVPSNTHYAVFYGLAKAAGTDLSAETVTFGTYPTATKTAIKTMLGVVDPPVTDVQVNGVSVLNQGVANIPAASSSAYGTAKINTGYGISITNDGALRTYRATNDQVKAGTHEYVPIVPYLQHRAIFYGLAKIAGADAENASNNTITNNVGTYSTVTKRAIQNLIGVESGVSFVETVSDATPSITGEANTRYICGEVTQITITPPSVGTIDVLFTRGSAAATLSVPNTVKFPSWFDATSLEANTTYEILITDGVYGSVMLWDN